MGNVNRGMVIIRMNQKERLEIKKKNTVTEMKSAFGGLISSLGVVEKRISKLAVCQQKLPKVNSREKKDQGEEKKQQQHTEQNVQKLWGNYKMHNKC